MSDDNISHPKFSGRTYGRSRISQACIVFDQVVSSEPASVTVKESQSLGASAGCVSESEGSGITSDPKQGQIEKSESDEDKMPSQITVSFDGDRRKAKPRRRRCKMQIHPQKETEIVTVESDSRYYPVKEVTAAEFSESEMKETPEESAHLFKESLVESHMIWEEMEDLSPSLKKPPAVKLYLKKISPDDKADSSLLTKYKCRKPKARGRRYVTIIEDYNSNSTKKILTGKLNPSEFEAFKSSELPKQDLATVPVCKHTNQLAKGKRRTKYSPRLSTVTFSEAVADRSQEGSSQNASNDSVRSATVIAEEVAPTTSIQPLCKRRTKYSLRNSKVTFSEAVSDPSQEDSSANANNDSIPSAPFITEEVAPTTGIQPLNVFFMEESLSETMSAQEIESTNVSNDSVCSGTAVTEEIPIQASTQNVLFMVEHSSQRVSLPASNSSNPMSPRSSKCRTKAGNYDSHSADSTVLLQISLPHDDNCLVNLSPRPVEKQYRIFKSWSAKIKEKLQPTFFRQEDSPLPRRQLVINAGGDSQVMTPARDKLVTSPASLTSSQASDSAELTPVVKCTVETINYQHIDISSVTALHATPYHTEQGIDSASVSVLDMVSFSEPSSQSQETLSNSQKSLEGESQKSSSPAVTEWKFFKSKKSLPQDSDAQKRIFASSPQKLSAKASYNMRSWNSENKEETEEKTTTVRKKKKTDDADVGIIQKPEEGPKLKREMHWPVGEHDEAYTTLTVSKSHKELYTVIQNVRQTHEVQELGETHDFIKEIDYLLDSLKETNSNTIRCLSCLQLASKCISPAFRMHMRVHGTISRIFNLLEDACSDPNLALSTAALMFVLSRDRLSMDLDHHSLSLMLKLNENDAGDVAALDVASMQGLERTRQKVKELLGLLQETYSREVDLDFVSTSSLALESLLSLTSRRAGEWFKEELRSVGGLDHIVDSVRFCEKNLPEDLSGNIQKSLPVLRKLIRCLRVLENISYMNSENQNYLLLYRNSALLQSCSRILLLCQLCLPAFKLPENLDSSKAVKDLPGHTVLSCMLIVLRVMINITHSTGLASLEEGSLMETVVKCLTMTILCVPVDQRFDLAVQCLVLLSNLVEHQEGNRRMFMEMKIPVRQAQKSLARTRTVSSVSAVVELFVQREQAAREMEEEIGSISDSPASPSYSLTEKQMEAATNVQQASSNQNMVKKKQKNPKTSTCSIPIEECGEHQENQSILDDCEETFTKALHKAGKHMENSIVAAYAAIFLGSLIADSKEYTSVVKKLLPKGDFGPMVTVLSKFLRFMVLVTTYDHADVRLIERVIEVLKSA